MAQSPRFQLRRKEIAAAINKTRLKETWKNKVRSAVRDQFLPDPLDYYDYQLNINRISERLENLVLSGAYVPRAPRPSYYLRQSHGTHVASTPIDGSSRIYRFAPHKYLSAPLPNRRPTMEMKKNSSLTINPFATFTEWSSQADEAAYASLSPAPHGRGKRAASPVAARRKRSVARKSH